MSGQVHQALSSGRHPAVREVDAHVRVVLERIGEAEHEYGTVHVENGFLQHDRARVETVAENQRRAGGRHHGEREPCRSPSDDVDQSFDHAGERA